MRQASVAAKLHHLWVDHQHADFVRSPSHQYRRDDRVQTHTLTGTGSASDQQVWQARQVYRQGLTRNVFTEEQRNLLLPDLRTALFDHFTHADDLTFFIRHFDSNTVLARDRSDDADARNTQRDRQIIGEASNLAESKPSVKFDLVQCDYGTGFNFDHFDIESEICKRLLQYLGLLLDLLRLLVVRNFVGLSQQIKAWQHVLFAPLRQFRIVEMGKRVFR